MQGTSATGSDGSQSLKPKGKAGARALVAREDVGRSHSRDANVGGAPIGDLEKVNWGAGKAHRGGGKTTPKEQSQRSNIVWRRRADTRYAQARANKYAKV